MIVLLTGATGNLGPAVQAAFERGGHTVVAVSRSGPYAADLTRREDAERIVELVLKEHGRLDVMAHALGGFTAGRVAETGDDTWRQMIDLNLNAAFYTIRAAIRPMIAQGHGRIIAVGSRAGVLPSPGMAAYNVSKAGLQALIQSVALEVAGTGITANAVLPSVISKEKGITAAALAETIVWLASDDAAGVNGALMPLYGNG
jgi:NAD(P)-dependent dehydrogenase (short-subunit alcohol dehydrogenase family)